MMQNPSIKSVAMQGFKCFDTLKLELGQLTLVTGINGGGKSTALQAMLLAAQAFRPAAEGTLPLNGPLVHLGTAGDIAPPSSEMPTQFIIESPSASYVLTPSLQAGDRNLRVLIHPSENDVKQLQHALLTLSFIGAVRIGASDSFPIPEHPTAPDVGHDGRFAPYWYDRMVDEEIIQERHFPNLESTVFRKQLDAWLGSLFPGAEANVQNVSNLSQMNLQFRLAALGSWRRPSNIGYGLTYVFPILVSLLAAQPGQVIVIDSPESHLHPFAQSQMGKILASFANSGIQIVVETHSDHLLNGVRLAVREGILPADDLRVHFFGGPQGTHHGVTSPMVGPGGEIDEWPDGFFDQAEKDLARLAGWA